MIVSDTASKDASADKSGPAIMDILKREGFQLAADFLGSHDEFYKIVPDDNARIQAVVKGWADGATSIDWIITTGGTGFGVRDVTPEAIKPLLDREASGLVHLLLSSSLQHTPLAALSRPVAGTRGTSLITTLPGSVKAVKENLEALLNRGVISHALDLVRGGSGKDVHATLSQSTGPPVQTIFTRHRHSPYPLISFEAAIQLIKDNVQTLSTETVLVNPHLRNHILAEDVFAPQDAPPRATTSADGYALRSTDPPAVYKVVTSRNHPIDKVLPPGYIYRINTGGPLPNGTDTVIMVEDTKLVSTFEATEGDLEGEEKEIETLAQVPPGENVRAPGSDVRRGDLVLQRGERVLSNGGEIGTLSFVGRKEVTVYKKPVVGILSTGNEIVDLHNQGSVERGEWGGIFDTNRPSLHAAIESLGYTVVDLGIVPDTIEAHVTAIQEGIEKTDIMITTGGTSMGPTDLLKPVIERHFNGTIHFGRVTIKPGKPTTFATIPTTVGVTKPLFALPGNPASALVTFHIFLKSPMPLDPRTEFHRVVLRAEKDGLNAYSTGGQRSSRVASLSGANGFVVLPPKTVDGPSKFEAGTEVEVVVIGEIQHIL
ncbi:Gephyrin [Leucoagaricus sp. SymC.cos]|nr:Gephyrin [Leucoagaricus sp. SymC.cos]